MKTPLLLLVSLLLASCSASRLISQPDPGTPGIILAQEQKTEHKFGPVTFPAGQYLPEAKSESGIYYAAPTKVTTGGIMNGGKEHGGLFVTPDGQQFLWIGQPGYQLQQAPGTLLGSYGVETPLLHSLRQRVEFRPSGP